MMRVPTGVPGLDAMLGGGIPRGNIVLLYGGPGSGKTTLALQFLYRAAVEQGENTLYVSVEEKKNRIYERFTPLGFKLEETEKAGRFHFLDATPIRLLGEEQLQTASKFPVSGIITRIRELVTRNKITRIAIDPLTILSLMYQKPYERRQMLYELFTKLSDMGVTTLMVAEMRESGARRTIEVEEYLADGIISLRTLMSRNALIRVLQVEKMRGAEVDIQPRPYTISKNGIVVHSDETIFV
ncbi:MAG: AAA family ATPase [Aigarchaeota archaeon]|nr:AAA family ATPase [Candidatus Pelearchaeum maunauluense]